MTEQLKNRPGDQPLPVGGGEPVMAKLVGMLKEREELGIQRYGTPLMTHNGRNSLRDAIEETVDALVYLTQVEMEAAGGRRAVFTQVSSIFRRYALGTPEDRQKVIDSGLHYVHPEIAQRVADYIDVLGMTEEGAEDPDDFFVMGNTYVHEHEGIFLVKYVGRPPQGFEYPSELLGVAFGWRCDARPGAVGAPGAPEGFLPPPGQYTTSDFAGWELQQ